MKKIFIILLFILTTSHALVIETNANQWKLVGTDGDISNLDTINFNQGDLIWQYSQSDTQNPWKCYRHGASYITEGTCETISTIGAGSGFWIYSFYDNNITINTQANTYEKTISDSNWTLFTPILKDYNVSDIFNDTNISVIWGYDTNWSFADDQNSSSSYSQLSVLEKNKGYWFYNPTNESQYITGKSITFGSDTVSLNNGNFGIVTKSNSDTVEDIWNVSFPINLSNNYNTFDIEVHITVYDNDASPDEGYFTFKDLNISGEVVSDPNSINVYAIKKDYTTNNSGEQIEGFISSSDTISDTTVLENSISTTANMLNINIGYIMRELGSEDISKFTATRLYDLNISFTQPISSDISGTIDIQ